jgi:hypothetical protein
MGQPNMTDFPQIPTTPPKKDNTQLFGILGIVLAIACCPPLGILFGYLSMQEAKKAGKDDTLGKVGFWLGIAMTAIGLIGAILAACLGGFSGWQMDRDTY